MGKVSTRKRQNEQALLCNPSGNGILMKSRLHYAITMGTAYTPQCLQEEALLCNVHRNSIFTAAPGRTGATNQSPGAITRNSDKKLKTDSENLYYEACTSVFDKVAATAYRRLDYETDKRRCGFIAQDVEVVLPESIGLRKAAAQA